MINGNFFINSKNAFDYFGVLVADGGYKGFFSPPQMKKIEANDWPEEDGIEPDLSAPAFEARAFEVDFLCTDTDRIAGFFSELIKPGYQSFELSELGVSFSLRYVDQRKTKRLKNGEVFSLMFSEDVPLAGYEYTAPAPVALITQNYALDGLNLSSGYGLLVGEGTDDSFRSRAAAKSNLTVSSKSESGVTYDTGIIKLKTRDADATLLFRTPTVAIFWQNYRAFLSNLKRPGERTISGPFGAYSCIYKSGSIKRFEKLSDGGVWCEMKLKFTIL
jgi:hypothetical protein